MSIRERLSGNEAIATAMRQINPDVVAAFPITPSTEIPQYFSSYVANGKVDSVFVPVESEHSAMSATIGASAAGARAMTATSSCGLAYMWEMLYVAASDRLPLALALVNRALSGPININCVFLLPPSEAYKCPLRISLRILRFLREPMCKMTWKRS